MSREAYGSPYGLRLWGVCVCYEIRQVSEKSIFRNQPHLPHLSPPPVLPRCTCVVWKFETFSLPQIILDRLADWPRVKWSSAAFAVTVAHVKCGLVHSSEGSTFRLGLSNINRLTRSFLRCQREWGTNSEWRTQEEKVVPKIEQKNMQKRRGHTDESILESIRWLRFAFVCFFFHLLYAKYMSRGDSMHYTVVDLVGEIRKFTV